MFCNFVPNGHATVSIFTLQLGVILFYNKQRIIAEQIINGESDEELLKQYPNELVERAHLYAFSLYY